MVAVHGTKVINEVANQASKGQGKPVVPRLFELYASLGVPLVPADTDPLARLHRYGVSP